MTGLGTDVLAMTCILCGAAAGGGLTLALMDQHGEAPTTCAVETVSLAPGLVVTGSSHGHALVLARPRVAVGSGDCRTVVRSVVEVDVDGIRRSVEGVRVDVERARAEVEAARARMGEARARLEESRVRGEEAEVQEIQIRLERLDAANKGGSY